MVASLLVVDDEPAIRQLVKQVLERGGHRVTECSDGEEAGGELERGAFDLVISDLSMPKMTGRELAQRLARDRPELPIVLMGGVVDSNVAGLGVRVLTKPFGRQDLVKAIEAVRRPPG